MARDRSDDRDAVTRRYGHAAAAEWQRLLSHFALAEGFALLVLVVPDADGANLCRAELGRVLAARDQHLVRIEPRTPAELRQMAAELLEQPADRTVGAVWLAAVSPVSARDFPDWEVAWQSVLEGLNQRRNPLRRHFDCPFVVVAAPWVVPLFRDVAPDLWSVRSQVIRIEPDETQARSSTYAPRDLPASRDRSVASTAPDPALALREVERLRGVPGRERALATMLERMGSGLWARGTCRGPRQHFGRRHPFALVTTIVSGRRPP